MADSLKARFASQANVDIAGRRKNPGLGKFGSRHGLVYKKMPTANISASTHKCFKKNKANQCRVLFAGVTREVR